MEMSDFLFCFQNHQHHGQVIEIQVEEEDEGNKAGQVWGEGKLSVRI
jgi:hypothetical protein